MTYDIAVPDDPTDFYECKDCCIQWTETEHENCCPECGGSRYFNITAEEYNDDW